MKQLPSGAIAHIQVTEVSVVPGKQPTAVVAMVDRQGRAVGKCHVEGFGDEALDALRRLFDLIEADFAAYLGGGSGTEEVAPITFGLPPTTSAATPTDDGRAYDENS